MNHPLARRRRLSASRALVCDILHYDGQMPSFGHSRLMELAELDDVRQRTNRRISWSALFLKAYGLLSTECPLLRQALIEWPWPHVYEHPQTIGTLAVSRQHEGQPRLCWMRVRQPAQRSLIGLQEEIERHQREPVGKLFRRQLQLSRLPTPLRRMAWWCTFNLSGQKRATRLGTFGLTTLAGQGATIERPPSIHTSTLTYGPLDEWGRSRVTIVYDHRLMDGLAVAGCLSRLEELLQGPILAELRPLCSQPPRPHHQRREAGNHLRSPLRRAEIPLEG
jgi:hypothetical protein